MVVQGEAGSAGLKGNQGKRGERVSNIPLLEIIFERMLNVSMIMLTINALLAPLGNQRHKRSKRTARR